MLEEFSSTLSDVSWLFVIMSLIGNYFVIKKNVVGQWIWAASNLGWIYYDITLAAYSQAFLFGIYFCLCVWGIIAWSKTDEKPAQASS